MERLLVWTLLLLLLLSVSRFSDGEKDRGFHVAYTKGKPTRPELNQGGSGLCLCPGSQGPETEKKHGQVCPCEGFVVPQSGRHRRHSHPKHKHRPHPHRKHKCGRFQSNCQHRHLLNGLQIPL